MEWSLEQGTNGEGGFDSGENQVNSGAIQKLSVASLDLLNLRQHLNCHQEEFSSSTLAIMSLPFAFRPSTPLFGGKLWYSNPPQSADQANCHDRKISWRISANRKFRHRSRLRNVDSVVDTVSGALAKLGLRTRAVERWKREMPSEAEMRPKDKYTMFSRYSPKYRKGIHSKCLEPLMGEANMKQNCRNGQK
jgi:Mitochondrial ribosomal protein L31